MIASELRIVLPRVRCHRTDACRVPAKRFCEFLALGCSPNLLGVVLRGLSRLEAPSGGDPILILASTKTLTPRVQALLAAELDRYEWRPHLRIAPGDRTTTPFGGAPTQGWWAPGWLQIMENDRCTAGINAPRPTEARVGTPWHVTGWRTRVEAAVETFFHRSFSHHDCMNP